MFLTVLLASTTADICALPDSSRLECGFPGITAGECHTKGCCFAEPGGDHQCSKAPLPCQSRSATCSGHGDCAPADPSRSMPAQCKCDAGYTGSRCEGGGHVPRYLNVSVVHVINSCHLDIGFADSAAGIVNRYFDKHIPYAAYIGNAMRDPKAGATLYANKKINFMFQSWIVSMYLNCPPDLGLHCPSASAVAAFEGAVAAGDITWHAFPHNAELAVMDQSLVEAGLALTWALDERFNVSRKQTLSQRDVPGLTRALVPLLKRAGVRSISIGANDGATPPDVPAAFLWKDLATPGKDGEIVTFLNWPGYGSWHPTGAQVVEPVGQRYIDLHTGRDGAPLVVGRKGVDGAAGDAHALVYNFNGDNLGPMSVDAYKSVIASIKSVFPNAVVVASTFDNFTRAVADEVDAGRAILPVVTSEMADTWIYGVPSDPQKVARGRVINRAWASAKEAHVASAEAKGASDAPPGRAYAGLNASAATASWLARVASDPVLLNATRFALKYGEHTWGKDVKSNLFDNYNWRNSDFHAAKSKDSANYSQYHALEESWWEQRHWGVTLAVTTLADAKHPMAAPLLAAMADLRPTVPTLGAQWKRGAAGQTFRCDSASAASATTLVFDARGAIARLAAAGSEWASENRTLLSPTYRSYSAADVDAFFAQYVQSSASWVQHDYGKPGLKECCASTVLGKLWEPTMSELWYLPAASSPAGAGAPSVAGSTPSCRFALKMAYDADASAQYGAPEAVWMTVDVDNAPTTGAAAAAAARPPATSLQVVVGVFNKTQTRLPEAMFMRFNPDVASTAAFDVNKLGSWIDTKVVVNGGSKHLHNIVSTGAGLRIRESTATSTRTMAVECWDAGVVNLGELNAYPSPVNVTADTAAFGSSVVLWDNLWGTNYVMWWPFEQPPPAPYASSQELFPAAWNANMVSRFNITLSAQSGVIE